MSEILNNNIKYFIESLPELQDIYKDNKEFTLADIKALADIFGVPLDYCFKYNLKQEEEDIKSFSSHIKILALDVDGVLTDAGMYITTSEDEIKKFNAQDGIAIQFAIKKGITVILLSSGLRDEIISYRARMLKIPLFYVGKESKWEKLKMFSEENGIDTKDVAYIGDDVNDLVVLENVGLSVCPQNAVSIVKKFAKIHLYKNGGTGAVREFIERLFEDIFS
jgi:3-deoxy-D-manno-octulosonate 8-phosphate phosphatase (KDO 8-P phosphatase)